MIERLGKQLSKEQRDLEVLDVILSQHPIGISRIA
ncbi:MAG: putative transcriptional regulator, partial [Natronomonas sp.]